MLDHTTTIELAANTVAIVSPSLVFPDHRIAMNVFDRGAWSNFGIELTPDTARQLAAALVAQADAMQARNTAGGAA
ncbi:MULTISPECIES: hypothetical protein [Giesbergeria]|uniref:Uncharacterized protein n=1 Tax=Giesbergeria sinuosa TaxID=80883 RepID=A0ABV9QEC3_9BURK